MISNYCYDHAPLVYTIAHSLTKHTAMNLFVNDCMSLHNTHSVHPMHDHYPLSTIYQVYDCSSPNARPCIVVYKYISSVSNVCMCALMLEISTSLGHE